MRPICLLLALMSVAASPMPRVRSTTPAIALALEEAQRRSPTFNDLVRTIEGTDGIVYVERGQCRRGVHACLSHSVTSGGGFRFLRILVDQVDDAVELMATIGHELRHAIELLSEPSVRTASAAYNFYAREAPTMRGVFETPAAVRAGVMVAAELAHSRR
jgi:hypothetical protein